MSSEKEEGVVCRSINILGFNFNYKVLIVLSLVAVLIFMYYYINKDEIEYYWGDPIKSDISDESFIDDKIKEIEKLQQEFTT